MRELDPQNAVDYLRQTGRLSEDEDATAAELAGGVSNVVLRIAHANGDDFVLKQSRAKLRTAVDWRSRLERIWREADVMRTLSAMLPAGTIPRVLFEDRENYLFAMEAVAADHVVWKHDLLRGNADGRIAHLAAEALAGIHGQTAGVADLRQRWSDLTVFDELRLDPYYRFIAGRHPKFQPAIDALIAESISNSFCVVSADFSPKNILIAGDGISVVDFETAHYGDPAFDLGFFLTHLLLKSVYHGENGAPFLALAREFWCRYIARLELPNICDEMRDRELAGRTVKHLAACLLARVDGKSPVEYLNEPQQAFVRELVLRLFERIPNHVEDVFDKFGEHPASAG